MGKGAAVRTALGHARGELAAIMDADLEYDPDDLGGLLPPLRQGLSNAVFGVRAFDGYTSHSFMYVMGNKGVTLAANILFNVYLRDIMTCHKAIRTDVFRNLPLPRPGSTTSRRSPRGRCRRASASTRGPTATTRARP